MVQFTSMPIRRWLAPCALFAVWLPATLTAQAQPGVPSTRSDPLDPKAGVPPLSYQPSFSQYRRLDDGKPISWREANDTVTRIGGWRVYAREAQQPDAAASAAPSASAPAARPASPTSAPHTSERVKPMPAGHDGHKLP